MGAGEASGTSCRFGHSTTRPRSRPFLDQVDSDGFIQRRFNAAAESAEKARNEWARYKWPNVPGPSTTSCQAALQWAWPRGCVVGIVDLARITDGKLGSRWWCRLGQSDPARRAPNELAQACLQRGRAGARRPVGTAQKESSRGRQTPSVHDANEGGGGHALEAVQPLNLVHSWYTQMSSRREHRSFGWPSQLSGDHRRAKGLPAMTNEKFAPEALHRAD